MGLYSINQKKLWSGSFYDENNKTHITIDMRQTIRLTEDELRDIIEKSINEAIEDEGFLRNIGTGLKSAFGNDFQNLGNRARNVGNAVRQGAQNLAQGVSNKYNDMKVGYNAGRQNDQLNNIKNTIQKMLKNGTLGKGSVAKAAQNFIYTLQQAIQNNNYAASNPRGIMANRLREGMERNGIKRYDRRQRQQTIHRTK